MTIGMINLMANNDVKIFYPRGGGGSWLSNLIWHLENANFSLPTVTMVFDREPRCSIPFTHKFEIPDPHQPDKIFKYKQAGRNVLFSCQYLFNHYLNNAIKVEYHIHNLGQLTLQQQLFALSNSARYYFTDSYYHECYCKNIDLDYLLIFQNPEQFADCLLEFLHSANINFTENKTYILESMNCYRSTCPAAEKHFDNWNSMLWLGCCQAIAMLDQLPIDVIPPDADKTTIAQILRPHAERCKQRIAPMMFE
jgi:hypothetical protein